MTRELEYNSDTQSPESSWVPSGGYGCNTVGIPHWYVAADVQGSRSIHSGVKANIAARMDAFGFVYSERLWSFRDLCDLYLLHLADDDQHCVWRGFGEEGVA